MLKLRIKQSIAFYNDNRKAVDPKMNLTSLGKLVLPDMNPRTAGWYIGRWCDGKETGKMSPMHIYRIWQETGVSLYFLFGIDEEKA